MYFLEIPLFAVTNIRNDLAANNIHHKKDSEETLQ